MPDGLSLVAGALGGPGDLEGFGPDARMNRLHDGGFAAFDSVSKELVVAISLTRVVRVNLVTKEVRWLTLRAGTAPGSELPGGLEFNALTDAAIDPTTHRLILPIVKGIRTVDLTTGTMGTLVSEPSAPNVFRAVAVDAAARRVYVVRNDPTPLGSYEDCVGIFDLDTGAEAGLRGCGYEGLDQLSGSIAFDTQSKIVYTQSTSGPIHGLWPGGYVDDIVTPPNGPRLALDSTTKILYATVQSTITAIDLATKTQKVVAGVTLQPGYHDGVGDKARVLNAALIAFDADARLLYITNASVVRQLDPQTAAVTSIAGLAPHPGSADGVSGNARFAGPRELAYDANSRTAFVADTANVTIRSVNLDTRAVGTLAGYTGIKRMVDGPKGSSAFVAPVGIAIDAKKQLLYVIDSGSGIVEGASGVGRAIRAVDIATGAVRTIVGGKVDPKQQMVDGPRGTAKLQDPRAIVATDAATLYFTDANTVRRVDLATGEVSTVAGASLASLGPACIDGPFGTAKFGRYLGSIIFDEARKRLYVADPHCDAIRMLDLTTSSVTTLAGTLPAGGAMPSSVGGPPVDGPPGTATFSRIGQLAYDVLRDELYVVENADRSIDGQLGARSETALRAIDVKTGVVRSIIRNGPDRFGVRLAPLASASMNQPVGVASIGAGTLLISDFEENSLLAAKGF